MARLPKKKQWKTGTAYDDGKRDGVAAVLKKAGSDEEYRKRLLSRCPQEVIKAFNEVGDFEKLPYGFRIECFERDASADPVQTDNVLMLVLPELGTTPPALPKGGVQQWQCTYLPYKARKKSSRPKKRARLVK